MTRIPLSVLGVRLDLEVPPQAPEEFLGQVRATWAGAVVVDHPDDDPLVLPVPWSAGDEARVLDRLSAAVTVRAIDANAGRLLMLHAAGLADERGRVLALVGPSGRGKTTATLALGRALGYVSDETVGIARDGTVLAHRKPLSLVQPGEPVKRQVPPGELGLGEVPDAGLRIAGVVLLDRRADGPEVAELSVVPVLDALEEIVPQTSYLSSTPGGLGWLAGLGALTGGFVRVTYREAGTLAPVLAELFDASEESASGAGLVAGSEAWAGTGAGASSSAITTDVAETGRCRRGAVADVVHDSGEMAVLAGAQMVRLGGIGPTIWSALAEPGTVGELVDAVTARHGMPPGGADEAERLVEAGLAELERYGLVERGVWYIG